MPAWYSAIMMESGEVQWRSKFNPGPSDAGPDDNKLIIDFEGDLHKMPWITDLSCENAAVDVDALVASVPTLFDKPWLRGKKPLQTSVAALGNHYIIEIQL
jgi:hypothetical protein